MIKNKKFFFWAMSIIWMALIFILSSMKGDGYHSYRPIYFAERKTFHVIEYLILTLLVFGAFSQDYFRKKAFVYSVLFAFIYAASDEWHQTFVFGREGVFRDVAIDFLGIIAAVIFISQFYKWKTKK